MGYSKTDRVLGIYTKLMSGAAIDKAEEAQRYDVDKKTIQRDIDDIRDYLASGIDMPEVTEGIEYDRAKKAFGLSKKCQIKLTNGEILAVCKILLDSRALPKAEMTEILDKLISGCVPEKNQQLIEELIKNEIFHYVEPRHKAEILETMWDIGLAIKNCRYIEIDYERTIDRAVVTRKIRPAAIMFSEYYFYLTAFIDDKEIRKNFDVINDSFPTIYRIDRIKRLKVLKEGFTTPYRDRFEEGEFRKRVQFMYGGKLQKVKFKYSGSDIDAVLDRLPTAKVLDEKDGVYTVSAETFGKGIDMWLRSQGDSIEIL